MTTAKNRRTTVVHMQKGTLKRVLGIFDLFAVGYGDLGSSIYYALGITALFALGATPISLALAGLVFVCTALTYAEMTSTFHESGGSASFARHAFNDLISFIAGWGLLLDYVVTIAISAFAVGPYLAYFYDPLHQPSVQISFSVSLVALLFLMNAFGIKQSTRISLVLTAFTLLIQFVVIAIGVGTVLDLPHVISQMRIGIQGVNWSPSWPDFIKGTAMAMVAYTGIESIAQLAAEAQKPSKTVPRAIVMTMGFLLFIYLGISVVALSVVAPHTLGTTYLLNPVAGIVDALPFGQKILSPCIALIACLVLTVASNAGLVGASRLSFNMGEYYQLPRFFYRLHPQFRTPIISLFCFTVAASFIILASRGKMDFLADLYNFGAMIAFTSAHLSLIVLRIKKPHLKRTFRIPGNIKIRGCPVPITALLGCVATTSVWFLVVITKKEGRYLGLAWMIFGLAMYVYYRRFKKIQSTGQIKIEQVKVPGFKPMSMQQVLVLAQNSAHMQAVQMACEVAKWHQGRVSVLQVIDIASSVPLDASVPHEEAAAVAILKSAEAIARELNVEMDLKVVRSRSLIEALREALEKGNYDLLILGTPQAFGDKKPGGLVSVYEPLLKSAPCRVWICS